MVEVRIPLDETTLFEIRRVLQAMSELGGELNIVTFTSPEAEVQAVFWTLGKEWTVYAEHGLDKYDVMLLDSTVKALGNMDISFRGNDKAIAVDMEDISDAFSIIKDNDVLIMEYENNKLRLNIYTIERSRLTPSRVKRKVVELEAMVNEVFYDRPIPPIKHEYTSRFNCNLDSIPKLKKLKYESFLTVKIVINNNNMNIEVRDGLDKILEYNNIQVEHIEGEKNIESYYTYKHLREAFNIIRARKTNFEIAFSNKMELDGKPLRLMEITTPLKLTKIVIAPMTPP